MRLLTMRITDAAELTMKLQPIEDLVDHLALGAQREPDEIEVASPNRLDRGAVGGVVGGREHVLDIERGRDVAGQRAFERARQRRAVGAVDQDRLADQRQIARAGTVFVSVADAFRKRRGYAAGQER